MDTKFRWAPLGLPACDICLAKHSERWSILLTYSHDGYITYDIVHGSYNTELFYGFIGFIENKVLLLCSPYPGPKSVLIMDNASIYRSLV